MVRTAIPSNTKAPHLADSLVKTAAEPLGAKVSIGNEATPYPAHLEWGHKLKNVRTMPARPGPSRPRW